ncbi:hypothetical protein B0H10DRAFT_2232790 [Mycena sp. CBHHK59/15]|nr:hypothetical protein B0H10DRAFT_2232790 [Mycena sp. CBHHK59/15]
MIGNWVINTNGFHNAALLRKFLPVALTKPRPLFLDRRARHYELAVELAAQQQKKRATTKAKTAATRQKKKAEKEARERTGGQIADDDEGDASSDDGVEGTDPLRPHKRRRAAGD